jgi:hypothetical protein
MTGDSSVACFPRMILISGANPETPNYDSGLRISIQSTFCTVVQTTLVQKYHWYKS